MEKKDNQTLPEKSSLEQHEDSVLKTSMQFFADEILPYLGIEGTVKRSAPTELVRLELQKLYQDFNFEMEDGTWKHFEFQSTNEGLAGLKRFRAYEAMTSYQYKVTVQTYVLFSGKIQKPMTEFTEGLNTYRIYPIIMQHKNADEVLENLERKQKNGEIITKADLIPLILCPLMSGETSQTERVSRAYRITRKSNDVKKEDVEKIEAMIYAMADKFLDMADMEKFKEEITMTRLGQMIWEDGVNKGIDTGRTETLQKLIRAKLKKGKNIDEIAEDLEETPEVIRELMKTLDEKKELINA